MTPRMNGWLELRQRRASTWEGIIALSPVLVGSGYDTYDMFGCLFGICNFAHFRPIAAQRSLPTDVSVRTQQDFIQWGQHAHDHSWILWSEVEAINWEEEGEEEDSRAHRYIAAKDGQLVYDAKALFLGRSVADSEDVVYRVEKIRRREALTTSWRMLFEMIRPVAQAFGADNVRLVVWFFE